jgi:hypothetical protein
MIIMNKNETLKMKLRGEYDDKIDALDETDGGKTKKIHNVIVIDVVRVVGIATGFWLDGREIESR